MPLTRRTLLTAMAATPVLAPVGAAQAAVPQAGPAAASVAEGLPPGSLPAGHRFDLRAEPVDLFGKEIPLTQTRVHQQVAFDPVTGLAYAVQLMSGGRRLPDEVTPTPLTRDDRDRRGDLCVNQLAPDGTVLAVMYLRGFGHGGGLGVEHVDGTSWLWLETDADRVTSGFAYGKHIGRIAFKPDAVVDAGSALVEVFDPVPGASQITPSLDVDHGRIAVRHVSSGTAEYRVYGLDAFKSRAFTPERSFPAKYRTQSWCLYGNLVHQNEGNAYGDDNPSPGNSWWNVYDVTTGEVVERTFNTTALHLDHRETEAITVRRTPDGPQLVFGFATQEDRRMALYGITSTTDGTGDHVPWTELEYDKTVYTATSNYLPQYRQSGNRIDLHLRVTRADGAAWTSGETILTLPPHIRPRRTQGMVGQTTGAGVTGPLTIRWEVTADGSLRIYDERGFKGWIGLDAGYFTS
ncbi:signaling protein [Streptomyces sp. NBC_00572]|uniref:phage baseplate protein n=1 Tax=Streptomyces sp. NBC_00572 TaxID=2903664 RepID=UPI00224D3883|nr:signaling protein [Streptomyces sp. NBC_00572]MCX4982599.1 signaling protein [Streptomyces sp. NBC_00572]